MWKKMKFWSLFLILRVNVYTSTGQQTPLRQSLDCFNDYTTYTTCTWSEREDARKFIEMNLFYKDNESFQVPIQMSCNYQKSGSYRNWCCNEKLSYFSAQQKNTYIFKPNKKLEAQLNVSLIDNVQLPPPQKLSIRPIEGGHFQLEWEAGDGLNLSDEVLDFEVSYKRIWEHWEKSSSILVSNASDYLLRQDSLVPGCNYSARVRSILKQDSRFSGQPSKWSSEIHWSTQEGDEAQPKNLRCLFNGIDRLNCSWEVRREVTSSVMFSLFYQTSPGSEEKECSPVRMMELSPNIPYVLQSCEIAVTDGRSHYHVTVRPKEETKEIIAMQHIKPHRPFNLTIEKMDKQVYRLKWKTDIIRKSSNFAKRYEISYWKTSKPSENRTEDGNDSDSFDFTPQFLDSATHYKAKVRAKVKRNGYDGPWSEWSEEYDWETESSFPAWSLLLIAPTIIILMAVGLCCGCKYFLNKKQEWATKIPSPPRKFLLPDYFLKTQNSSLDIGSQSTVGEDEISYTTVLERSQLVTSSESLGAESGNAESLLAYHNMELFRQFPSSTANVGLVHLAVPSPTRDCISDAKGSLVQVFDFDGPYLQCPLETSVPDIQQNVNAAPLERREPSASLQYMELPQNLWPQQLPIGKKNKIVPPLSIVHDLEENEHPLSTGQEVPKGQAASVKLEQKDGGQRPQSRTTSKNLCQNGPLDYIATANLPLAIERHPSLLLSVESSNPDVSTGACMETSVSQALQRAEGVSSSELCLKDETPPAPSRTSQEAFGDYVMTLPGAPGPASKEGLPFPPVESQCNKDFFLFNPGDSNPVFLQQVGDYCFFPGTKLIKASKSPGGSVGHFVSRTNQAATKPHKKSQFLGGGLQPRTHISIDSSVLSL